MRSRQTRSPIHKHKRAISAPNFFRHPHTHPHIVFNSQLDTLPEPHTEAFTRPRLATMSSATSDGSEQPTGDNIVATPQRQPDPNSLIRCEKDKQCDMETPPRKMISQFFGRNKSCTKAIPRHVWLHFCRKHYQRERYQLGPDYPKLQSELLLDQIQRIQSWSDENVAKGLTNGVIRGWKLQLRKREEDRQSRNNADSDDEDGIAAVPQWLLESAGDTYDTERILAMMERLRDEINGGEVRGMPEVEILPDITTDQPKGPPKRRATRTLKTHRRAKSQGASRVTAGVTNLPGFNIPAVPPPVGHAAAQGLGAPVPATPGGPPSTTASLPNFNDYMTRRYCAGYKQAHEVSLAPRAEKRKAEDSLDPSMAPRSNRRVTVSHRPALQQVREERDPRHDPRHILSMPTQGHSRSRSDVSHRYDGGHKILPGFQEAFGSASDNVRAACGSVKDEEMRLRAPRGFEGYPERAEVKPESRISHLVLEPKVEGAPRHDRRGSMPSFAFAATETRDAPDAPVPDPGHISGLMDVTIAAIKERDPAGWERTCREGERYREAQGGDAHLGGGQ